MARLYRRDLLTRGQTIAGPAIVEQEDTTTLILPGWSAGIDAIGNLLITRDAFPGAAAASLQPAAMA